ncbi:MAG: CHRD domain-containing protein [Pseudonocardiaceae bacterium]
MRYGKGVRATGRAGLCLASVSSIVVLVGPTSAAAHEVDPADQAGNGHFSVQLTGSEVPGGGDPDGQGSATLDLDPHKAEVCFTITWSRLRGEKVTALHLNAAPRGGEGPLWIAFFDKQSFPSGRSMASGCVSSPQDKIDAVIGHPADYYLNVDSTTFGNGAIRGQLK